MDSQPLRIHSHSPQLVGKTVRQEYEMSADNQHLITSNIALQGVGAKQAATLEWQRVGQ